METFRPYSRVGGGGAMRQGTDRGAHFCPHRGDLGGGQFFRQLVLAHRRLGTERVGRPFCLVSMSQDTNPTDLCVCSWAGTPLAPLASPRFGISGSFFFPDIVPLAFSNSKLFVYFEFLSPTHSSFSRLAYPRTIEICFLGGFFYFFCHTQLPIFFA